MRGAWGAGRGVPAWAGLAWACRRVPGVGADGRWSSSRRTDGQVGSSLRRSRGEGQFAVVIVVVDGQGGLSPTAAETAAGVSITKTTKVDGEETSDRDSSQRQWQPCYASRLCCCRPGACSWSWRSCCCCCCCFCCCIGIASMAGRAGVLCVCVSVCPSVCLIRMSASVPDG